MSKLISCLALVISVFCTSLLATPPDSPSDAKALKLAAQRRYLRVQRDKAGDPIALQTSIVRFVPASGEGDVIVDLISAVHVGDASYYNTLNKQFDLYDVVLYELVAPKGTVIPKGGRKESDNPLATLMDMARMVLKLKSQTNAIDYTKTNFVHAESVEELMELLKKRGENGWTIGLSAVADYLRQQNLKAMKEPGTGKQPRNHLEGLDLMTLILDPNSAVKVKRQMAEQFDSQDVSAGFGKTIGRIIVEDRNIIAMRAFGRQLVKGKKRIAIFYGAAHNPDFEQRLIKEYGMKIQSSHWLTAWDLKLTDDSIQELFGLPKD